MCLQREAPRRDGGAREEERQAQLQLAHRAGQEDVGLGYTGSYTEDDKKMVISWLRHRCLEVRGNIKIKGSENTPTQTSSMSPDVF